MHDGASHIGDTTTITAVMRAGDAVKALRLCFKREQPCIAGD